MATAQSDESARPLADRAARTVHSAPATALTSPVMHATETVCDAQTQQGRGPLWLWVIVSAGLVLFVGSLRLIAFPNHFVPLTSALALLVCLYHRDRRILWGMTAAFMVVYMAKAVRLVPATVEAVDHEMLFAAMQFANTLIAASVIHMVIGLTGRLEGTIGDLAQTNAELEASNEELAAREEEITQQHEELQSQAEELEQQAEELNAQMEELQTLNHQLADRERSLADLLALSASGAGEQETLAKLGEAIAAVLGARASAAAVVVCASDEMVVDPLFGMTGGSQRLPKERTLADLILRRGSPGSLEDVALRQDLAVPRLADGTPVRSLAGAPLPLHGDAAGVLEVYSNEVGEWSQLELRLVQWLAEQCGRMLTTARLSEEREHLLAAEQSARQEAEAANRAKDEFVATLSHELRTPLTAVLGWATLLKRNRCGNPDETMKGIEVIERNARHQAQLISDLLDMRGIIAGKVHLEIGDVDLPLVIESALESVRLAAESKGVELERSMEEIDRAIAGDAGRLKQIVWNLLSNAIKFTPRGGRVRITASRVASYVQIRVVDTGEGIAPDVLPQLFDRYRQGDGSVTRRHGGLGLGLAIVKNLVDLHGGSIDAKSDGLGMGSAFTVLLPVRAVASHDVCVDKPPVEPELDPGALRGLSVLVVDDEADARDLVSYILRRSGASVAVAASAAEALEIAHRDPPDVLVSDIGMPTMDGYSLIRALRERLPAGGSQPSAIALTAFARSEERSRALEAGFQTHLAKPVEAAELIATVASLRRAAVWPGSGSPGATGDNRNE